MIPQCAPSQSFPLLRIWRPRGTQLHRWATPPLPITSLWVPCTLSDTCVSMCLVESRCILFTRIQEATAMQNAEIAFSPFLCKEEYLRLPGVGPEQMVVYHCTQTLEDKDWTRFVGNLDLWMPSPGWGSWGSAELWSQACIALFQWSWPLAGGGGSYDPFARVAYQISCKSDVYIMTYNGAKLQL